MSTNTAPFDIIPRLTQIAMAIRPTGQIADDVCPRVPVPTEKFAYTKLSIEEAFSIPDARVGRLGAPNQVEFGGKNVTDSTEDYGLDDRVPNKDIKNAEGTNYDPLAVATENTALLVKMAREQRVANLYFNSASYSPSLVLPLSGSSQWSDPSSDPVNAILTMFDSMLVRPNIGVLGRPTWTRLRQHPKVVAAVINAMRGQGGAAAAGVIGRKAVADLLELDDIFVGESFSNTAKKGQTAGYSRLWGKHAAFLRIDKNIRSATGGQPTFAFTAQWGDQVAGTIPSSFIGLEGGQIVRVGEHVKELIAFQEAGCFFPNAVA